MRLRSCGTHIEKLKVNRFFFLERIVLMHALEAIVLF